MRNIYYIVGAVILALIGLGIYTSRAEDATMSSTGNDGVLIIEEEGYAVAPADNAVNANTRNKTNGFEKLPNDPGVEVAPDNQPVVDRAMKNQNPNYNNGTVVIEEDVMETAN